MNTNIQAISQAIPDAPRVLEVSDVGRIYRISRTLQWQLRKSGDLPFRRHPGSSRVFYLREDVESYLSTIARGGRRAA
jgi:hypothetical protein